MSGRKVGRRSTGEEVRKGSMGEETEQREPQSELESNQRENNRPTPSLYQQNFRGTVH